MRPGTLSRIRSVPSRVTFAAGQFESRMGRPKAGVAHSSVKFGARNLDQVRARTFRQVRVQREDHRGHAVERGR